MAKLLRLSLEYKKKKKIERAHQVPSRRMMSKCLTIFLTFLLWTMNSQDFSFLLPVPSDAAAKNNLPKANHYCSNKIGNVRGLMCRFEVSDKLLIIFAEYVYSVVRFVFKPCSIKFIPTAPIHQARVAELEID